MRQPEQSEGDVVVEHRAHVHGDRRRQEVLIPLRHVVDQPRLRLRPIAHMNDPDKEPVIVDGRVVMVEYSVQAKGDKPFGDEIRQRALEELERIRDGDLSTTVDVPRADDEITSVVVGKINEEDDINVMDERTKAKMQGYEGDPCGDCGNFTLVRNGTCMKCNTCGATTGCS